ncbi:MAG: YcxB family protein [Lachnospiraceae bacterium]|nr:YcxB family protein [Lachnospiraceae bacterium]MDE6254133.1 YcxB family protein [Lachnospiraceae bacterium]
MKELILDYKLSREEYMEIQTYFMMRRSNIVKSCLALFLIGIILLITKLISGMGISGVWVLVVFPFPYIAYVAFKIRNIAYGMYGGDIKEWEVHFNNNGINAVAVKKKKNMETSWDAICKVWSGRKYVYLFFSKNIYLAIPLRAVKNMDLFNEYMQMAKCQFCEKEN